MAGRPPPAEPAGWHARPGMLRSVAIVDELRSVVGTAHVLVDADQRAGFEVDWTGRYHGVSTAVVRPGSTEEVAGVVRACARAGVAIVPQGGNTGLVGGSVPRAATICSPTTTTDRRPVVVLSLRRLDHLGPVDPAAMQVTAGAGVTLSRWRAHAHAGRARRAGRLRRHATRRRSAAPSPRTPVVRGCCGSERCVSRCSAWRPSWRAATSSARSPGCRRRPPGCTGRRCWRARKGRWRSSPRRACVSCHVSNTPSPRWCRCRRWRQRSTCSGNSVDPCRPSMPSSSSNLPRSSSVCDHLGRRSPVAVPADGTCLVVDCADHDDPTDQLAEALGTIG